MPRSRCRPFLSWGRAVCVGVRPEHGADKVVSMRPAGQPALFAPDQPVSPCLVDWHEAFAGLDPALSRPFTLRFDRDPYPPVIERLRLPVRPEPRDRRLCELYLSARINNVLCTAGASRVRIESEAGLDAGILAAVKTNLLERRDAFSNMSLHFLHGLIETVFGDRLTIAAGIGPAADSDPGPDDGAAWAAPAAPSSAVRPGTALAINIGQHLTSWGLVRLAADGSAAVTDLSRRETCPGGAPCCLTSEMPGIMAEIRSRLGAAAAAVDAVGISLAATVLEGVVRPVAEFGLFAVCPPSALPTAATRLLDACRSTFPNRPAAMLNDAKAQALFAFHHAGGRQAARGGHMLAVRLGACPCLHCLDAHGQSAPGFDEYGWLVTRACQEQPGQPLFSTPRLPLSHYGVAAAAHELGLLARYNLGVEEAIPFFYGRLLSSDPLASHEAARVYGVLGAHLAMLAAEIHRHRPLGAVMVLGSRANHLDMAAFTAMSDGFEAFAAGRALVPGRVGRVLLADASAKAGLVGAARTALAS
ncbi:hypothetical protein [Solidesulfovibrio sp.]